MTTFQNRILYLDGESRPITLDRLLDDLVEACGIIQGALAVAEIIRERGYDDEDGLLAVIRAALSRSLKTVDGLTPKTYMYFDPEADIRAATELAEAQKKYAAGQEA